MKLVSDTFRLTRFLLCVLLKAVHWASFKVVSGVTEWYPLDVLAKESKFPDRDFIKSEKSLQPSVKTSHGPSRFSVHN